MNERGAERREGREGGEGGEEGEEREERGVRRRVKGKVGVDRREASGEERREKEEEEEMYAVCGNASTQEATACS